MSELDFPLPSGYGWQYHLLLWLQSFHSPILDQVARAVSFTGLEWFYMLVLPVLFWAVNREIGLRLTYVFLTSMYVNAWTKVLFHVRRPTGVPGIRTDFASSASGLSMPSGHAQGTLTFWWMVGAWAKRRWLWFVALVLVFAIGVSRLYLGLHWPLDVLTGWAFGLAFAVVGWALGKWWSYRSYSFSIRLTMAIAFPLVLLLLHRDSTSASYASLLLGIGSGAALEERWLKLRIDPVLWKRISAAVIGIAGLIAVQWLIKWPQDTVFWEVLKGLLTGLWGTLLAPYVFELCGLYKKKDAD